MWDFVVKLLEPVWNSLDFWRCVGLILVIGILAAGGFHKQIRNILLSPQKRAHDERIFRDSDAIMSEMALKDMLQLVGSDARLRQSQIEMFTKYLRFFLEVGNQYIDTGLRNKHKSFLDELEKLHLFTAQHFFVEEIAAPASNLWCGLYPYLRHGEPEEHRRFLDYMNQLDPIASAVRKGYDEYRKLVKSKLLI